MNMTTDFEMDNLEEFLQTSKLRLQAILRQLQWTEEDVLRDFNTNSTTSSSKKETDDVNKWVEPMLPPSCADSDSIFLDKDIQQLLKDPTAKAPEKFSDFQVNFSREQKLLLYEITVKREVKQSLKSTENELVSLAEMVAMQKREKTKRRKYRICKPTQTEEIRSLIKLQMQALQHYLEDKHQMNTKQQDSKREIKSKEYEQNKTNEEKIMKYKAHRRYENQEKNSSRSHKRQKVDTQEHRISKSRKSRCIELGETTCRIDTYTNTYKSLSKSRCRHLRKKRHSRSPSKRKTKHHSRSRKKEKHKKGHKCRHGSST